MAKISFAKTQENIITNMNTITKVVFAHTVETRNLSQLASATKKDIEKLEKTDTSKFSEKELKEHADKIASLKSVLGVITLKRKALTTWRKEQLHLHKNSNEEWENGLFANIGIDKELFECYENAMASGDFVKWQDGINTLMVKTFGFNLKSQLVKKLAESLSFAIGKRVATQKDILNGKLTKSVSANAFYEVFAFALAEQIAKTNTEIVVPTAEFYNATISYDENLREVISYEVSERYEEEEEEEAKTEKTEKKSSKKSENVA